MLPIIRLQLNGNSKLRPYINSINALKSDLIESGVKLQTFRPKVIEPISTLIITIIGSVASHLLIKLINSLITKKEKNSNDNVQITIIYQNIKFDLPADQSILIKKIENN